MSATHHLEARSIATLEKACFDDEKQPTATSVEQRGVERTCLKLYEQFAKQVKSSSTDWLLENPVLNRSCTITFLQNGLMHLVDGYESLDASRPWLIYWILHSLELLGEPVRDQHQRMAIIHFLAKCQNQGGGFGGGPGQMSHLAPTYAAVNSLAILGGEEAYDCIDRQKLFVWLNSLRLPDGSFLMHEDGEVDIRGVYCALSVAVLTNIYSSDLFKKTAHWVLQCQTYEGGFGGVPGMESHGGYTFCGLASLILLNRADLCDVDRLIQWTVKRQMPLEGGFQGRTNKLVDGCYSFWQAGIFPLVSDLKSEEDPDWAKSRFFNLGALQEYVLLCCQDHRGGLVDKPGKSRDMYHTCYTLSGLSVAQNFSGSPDEDLFILGNKSNTLLPTIPLHNIGTEAYESITAYFKVLPIPRLDQPEPVLA